MIYIRYSFDFVTTNVDDAADDSCEKRQIWQPVRLVHSIIRNVLRTRMIMLRKSKSSGLNRKHGERICFLKQSMTVRDQVKGKKIRSRDNKLKATEGCVRAIKAQGLDMRVNND